MSQASANETDDVDVEVDPEDEDGNALCYGCLSEVVDQHGTLCDACEEEDAFRV